MRSILKWSIALDSWIVFILGGSYHGGPTGDFRGRPCANFFFYTFLECLHKNHDRDHGQLLLSMAWDHYEALCLDQVGVFLFRIPEVLKGLKLVCGILLQGPAGGCSPLDAKTHYVFYALGVGL